MGYTKQDAINATTVDYDKAVKAVTDLAGMLRIDISKGTMENNSGYGYNPFPGREAPLKQLILFKFTNQEGNPDWQQYDIQLTLKSPAVTLCDVCNVLGKGAQLTAALGL